jgi:hypothetical protein
MSYCPECGVKSDPNSQFCGSCGSSIQAGPSKPVKQAPQEPSGYQQPPQQPSGYQQPPTQPSGYQQPPQQTSGYQQPGYQQPGYQAGYGQGSTYQGMQLDEFPVWYYICAFFIFPVGIIVWATNKDIKPQASKNILIVTAVSIALTFFGVL